VRAAVLVISLDQKQYLKRQFGPESMELVSLLGTMARLEGDPVAHCHVVWRPRVSDFGGHLFESNHIRVTVESTASFEGEVSRRFDATTAPNLLTI